ncbi:HigA family addiction module antitoxin [Catalinimonas alkaloidigena]|nr:HigA family addiction module antitoxin [Catalinimonas alkaloidigena]
MYNPPHPGEIIREDYMTPLELNVTETAEALGITRANLSRILNGHAGISPNMALRLSMAFSTSPDMWLNMQLQYDLWQESQHHPEMKVKQLYSTEEA